ncbi:hypothetical protein [Rhizobacter sp. Root1221]|uniref:hypothetical protein n=1 Tax=Rhizobacter sp. Root1221 TaxID=1736433 RepID=UPI0012F977A9|nr:hypothetical protein [Rhizobacter sp. Root1221]
MKLPSLALLTCLLSGCSTLIAYRPQLIGPDQRLKYVQGVGTLSVKNEDHEVFIYPTFKTQGPTQPTFTIGFANNSAGTVDFSVNNIRAYFRGASVPIYTYVDKIDEIKSEKQGKQIALALLGGLAAGAAAYSASHQTYQSNYAGSVWTRSGSAGFAGSNTVRVYDPMSGIFAGAAVAGATGLGIRQVHYSAQAQEEAAASILQENTVDPHQMVTGNLILKDCCDQFSNPNDVIRFEVTANNRVTAFEFARVSPNAPAAAPPTSRSPSDALPAREVQPPAIAATAVPPVSETVPAGLTNPLVTPNEFDGAPTGQAIRARPVTAPASPRQSNLVVAEATPAAQGNWWREAEQAAIFFGCVAPIARLTTAEPGLERYAVRCGGRSSDESLRINCERGRCGSEL